MTISQLGTAFGKVGSPAGPLIYHLTPASGGSDLATGTMQTAAQTGAVPAWVYVKLSTPVTLVQGQSYRLWFASPSSTGSSNCYYQYVPYCDHTPSTWEALNWGGTNSYYQTGSNGSSWSTPDPAFDLSFSMQ